MSVLNTKADQGRKYHTTATGPALETVNAHQEAAELTLFGSCFCPFVQRVWVALEILGMPYKIGVLNDEDEVDPYMKPQDLLDVSPKGLVPAIRLENYRPARAINESTVILEFLEDIAMNSSKRTILPPITNPYSRALVRLQADHISRSLVPTFYRFLQAQDAAAQTKAGIEFHEALAGLVSLFERAERELLGGGEGTSGLGERRALVRGLGLWVEDGDGELGWADVLASPWLYRAQVVLTHYRGFEMPKGERFNGYLKRLFNHPAFARTCSSDHLYLDSYERYAFNRPNTSQVADAINSGRNLP